MRGKFIDVVEEITNLPIRKLKVSLKAASRRSQNTESLGKPRSWWIMGSWLTQMKNLP